MSHTPNLALPLLFAAQAQKEITHNEALVLVDGLLPGCVNAVASDPAALAPDPGDAWIIGASPTGAWLGRANHIAVYSEGGWRFVLPVDGMRLYDVGRGLVLLFDGGTWLEPPSITMPSGGTVVDAEARSVMTALIGALRQAGLLRAT